MSQAQRVTANVVASDWGPVTTGALQGFILSPVFFNIFKNYLDSGLEVIQSTFAGDAKPGDTDFGKTDARTVFYIINQSPCQILNYSLSSPWSESDSYQD